VNITEIPQLCINGTELDRVTTTSSVLLLVQTCHGTDMLHMSLWE